MLILENFPLGSYNTFGIYSWTKYFVPVYDVEDIQELIESKKTLGQQQFVLGGGSNVLFTKDFDGWILKNEMKGFDKIKENESHVWVECQGGENWHQVVLKCVKRNWAGIENLSLIPGSVGASPIQNIGAYGVELTDVFESLLAIDLSNGALVKFDKADCQFAYRESVFKNALKGKYFILSIVMKLQKNPELSDFKLSYGAIQKRLDEKNIDELNVKVISDTICEIRNSKLPNPSDLGNTGSFFKNAIVEKSVFESLKSEFPEIPSYPAARDSVKIPTAWLIEQAGWKGKRKGQVGVYQSHALVLVNYGLSTGKEVFDFSQSIIESVNQKFGIVIEREVNVL